MLAFSVDASESLPSTHDEADDEPIHGHDVHFLTRLSRVQARQADYALRLYRDPELVRCLLAESGARGTRDRVALALAEGADAPHVIVAANGAFVTCLGAGMSLGSVPTMSHANVHAVVERVADHRGRMRAYRERSKHEHALIERILTAGDTMSREDMHAISAFAPTSTATFLDTTSATFVAALGLQSALVRRARYRRHDRAAIAQHWRTVWGLGHLAMLVGSDGRALFDRLPSPLRGDLSELVAHPAASQLVTSLSLRGLWASGRIGKAMLEGWRAELPTVTTGPRMVEILFGATLVGARHRDLAREAIALIGTRFDGPIDGFADLVRADITKAFNAPDHDARWRTLGALQVIADGARMPKRSPFRYDDVERVPASLAYARAAQLSGDSPTNAFAHTLLALPWLARAEMLDFYLPEAYLRDANLHRYAAARGDVLAERARGRYLRQQPVRRTAPKLGRNEPCACGSGTKSKRCCG